MKKSVFILTAIMMVLAAGFAAMTAIGFFDAGMVAHSLTSPEVAIPGGTSLAIAFTGVSLTSPIGYQDQTEQMGGFGIVAYVVLHADVETWPTEKAAPTSLEDLVELEGNIVMKSGKKALKVLIQPNSGDFNPESQGSAGFKSFLTKGSFMIPGLNEKSRGLARLLNSSWGAVIIPERDGQSRIMIGTELDPVVFSPKGKSGKASADEKGFVFEYEAPSHAPGYTYNGQIPLSTGTVVPIS